MCLVLIFVVSVETIHVKMSLFPHLKKGKQNITKYKVIMIILLSKYDDPDKIIYLN